jgi:hypothetical protein
MRSIIFIILTLTIISCQKEVLSYTGNVSFSFINTGRTNLDEIHPQIFIIENLNTPLTDILKLNSKGETESIELNYGDYYLSYRVKYADNAYYEKNRVFQVKVDKTSNVIVDFNKD